MPQMGQMPSGAPSQMGLGALAMRQGPQMDPRLMEMMRRLQGGVPQGGPGMVKPDPQMLAAMQAFQQQGAQAGMPGGVPAQRPMPGMSAPGGVQFMDNLQAPVAPGDVLVQRPLPVGAGGKGAGMPAPGGMPGMAAPGGGLLPGAQRPMPMPPGGMVNPPRPRVQNNSLLAQMMRGGSR
jgi:hypothetical protein